jgi:hypothetical protein
MALMSDRKTSVPWIAGAVLLVLIGGYVGAYYWMIKPFGFGNISPFYNLRTTKGPYHYLHAPDSVVGKFFAPAHWLDRLIRPHVWNP